MLEEGQSYDQVWLLTSVDAVTPKDSKPFVKFVAKDMTGTIEGIVWNMKLKTTGSAFRPGKFFKMTAEVRQYKGSLNLSVNRADVFPYSGDPDNISDYVPGFSTGILDYYEKVIKSAIEEITDADIRDLMGNCLERLDLIHLLKTSPIGLTGPFACHGGLLVFTGTLVELVKSFSPALKFQDSFNESIAIAGAILKNIGWSQTTTINGHVVKPKNAHYSIGVHRSSFRFVNHLTIYAENDLKISIPESKRQALENFTSKSVDDIKTLEGKLVYHANEIVRIGKIGEQLLQERSDGDWTPGGELFRGHL